jgi:hypothetical protein
VARHVGRHSNQCINRWSKSVRPDITRGRWSKEEDELLKAAVEACGRSWKAVAPRVKGRTDAQCRERYMNLLNPDINKGPWSEEVSFFFPRRDQNRPLIVGICFAGGPETPATPSQGHELERD